MGLVAADPVGMAALTVKCCNAVWLKFMVYAILPGARVPGMLPHLDTAPAASRTSGVRMLQIACPAAHKLLTKTTEQTNDKWSIFAQLSHALPTYL